MLCVGWVPHGHCCRDWFCEDWVAFMEGNDWETGDIKWSLCCWDEVEQGLNVLCYVHTGSSFTCPRGVLDGISTAGHKHYWIEDNYCSKRTNLTLHAWLNMSWTVPWPFESQGWCQWQCCKAVGSLWTKRFVAPVQSTVGFAYPSEGCSLT